MNRFDDVTHIKKIDPQNTLESTEKLVSQCQTAWSDVEKLDIQPLDNWKPRSIVFCGMGASIYGGLVLKSLLLQNAPCPLEIVSDYHIPQYVNHDSLVVLTSYSGSTEEVLSTAEEAHAQGAKIVVITKGGALGEFAKKHNLPSYIFDGSLNPAGIPRLGNGYTIIGLIGLLNKLGVITIEDRDMVEAMTRLGEKQSDLRFQAETDSGLLLSKIPVIVSAEHLVGNAHILRNQFNETSKCFSANFTVPDLNHHLMEGLKYPKDAPLMFIQLLSENYSEKIQKRMELTKEVIEKNNFQVLQFNTSAQTFYDDFLEVMIYGSYLTLFLGLRNDENPAVNPWVDYFKENLKSS